MIEHLCKNCGKSFVRYNSMQSICGTCAYNKYGRPRKPVRRIGPATKQWIAARHEWIKSHPAEYWACYLCGKRLDIDHLTLDHVKSRSRHPELRLEQNNLQPCCWKCNNAKGSKDLSEIMEDI